MMKQLTIGLIVLCLASLTGCSSTPPIVRTVTINKTKYVLPPTELNSFCRVAEYQGSTNLDLYYYSQALIAELARCNVDWKAMNDWIKDKRDEQHDKPH
ncbi:Rz1-like lysis system protein LysC [Shewanella sp. GutCb]|uniref:Rz1-like lysis system protein LysC n=1 Tax=Shewanella sp. GutCb TaxID=2058315 RepID=UPI001C60CBA2